MSVFSDLRGRIKQALEDEGLRAFSVKPENFTPPAAFVAPGDPYITGEGATFDSYLVRHEVVVVAAAGVNETRADDVDDMLARAMAAFDAADINATQASRTGQINVNGQLYLSGVIDLLNEVRRPQIEESP